MTEKERFADLVGIVTPLKTPPQAEDFGKQAKILQRRRIEAQRIRHATAPQETRHNLAAIPDARFHALCAGRLPVAREIDLHGSSWTSAALPRRHAGRTQNRRAECWVIVHGKGRNSRITTAPRSSRRCWNCCCATRRSMPSPASSITTATAAQSRWKSAKQCGSGGDAHSRILGMYDTHIIVAKK